MVTERYDDDVDHRNTITKENRLLSDALDDSKVYHSQSPYRGDDESVMCYESVSWCYCYLLAIYIIHFYIYI